MNQTETGLNPMQMEAVEYTEGPLLILAGAGSGKTRVLTHRIASLIRDKGVNPWNIMAITFTNKAAGEMRERVDKIVGYGSERIWVSTFHSSCVRILRRHAERLGYANNFAIYDTDDQKSLIKDIMKRLQMDPKLYRDRAIMAAISSAKDEMIPTRFSSAFVSLLAAKYRNLCVVGDDDQSIYKPSSGANIENILSFEHVFPDAKVIKSIEHSLKN